MGTWSGEGRESNRIDELQGVRSPRGPRVVDQWLAQEWERREKVERAGGSWRCAWCGIDDLSIRRVKLHGSIPHFISWHGMNTRSTYKVCPYTQWSTIVSFFSFSLFRYGDLLFLSSWSPQGDTNPHTSNSSQIASIGGGTRIPIDGKRDHLGRGTSLSLWLPERAWCILVRVSVLKS